MVAPLKNLPRQHAKAKEQYQSTIKFQCAQPPVCGMPTMFRPTFDAFAFAQYRPNSLDSTTPQVAFISDDLGLPDLVDPTSFLPPPDLPRAPDGTPAMEAADVELLPDHQVTHHLRKLLGRQMAVPVWLRNTEYTELPLREDGLAGVRRTRRRTLAERAGTPPPPPATGVPEGPLEEGIALTFGLASAIDKEFSEFKAASEVGGATERQWLVHPNPARRRATPVGVWHVFPHYGMWRTPYVTVNFMDGSPNPAPAAPPSDGTHPSEHPSGPRGYDDALLLPLPAQEEAQNEGPPLAPGMPTYTVLVPREPRPKAGEDAEEEGEGEDSDENRPKKRSREYERVAEYGVMDDVALGRREGAPRPKASDLCLLFADAEGVANYVKLEDTLHLRRRPRGRGGADPHKGRLYVVEPRPLTPEEREARARRYHRLTRQEAPAPPAEPGPDDADSEESAAAIISGLLARHQAAPQAQAPAPAPAQPDGEEAASEGDDARTEVPEDADLGDV